MANYPIPLGSDPVEPAVLLEEELEFLYGHERSNDDIGPLYRRFVNDSGTADVLSLIGVRPDEWPARGAPIRLDMDSLTGVDLGPEVSGGELNVVSLMCGQFREKWERDRLFELSSNRWRKNPSRVSGYVPSDAGSLRWSLMPSRMFRADYMGHGDSHELLQMKLADAMAATVTYMATPHFIPRHMALDIATAQPLPKDAREELKLPERYVMVFHDGIPISVATSSDDELESLASGGTFLMADTLLIGAVLMSNDDGTLNTDVAYLILARQPKWRAETPGQSVDWGWNTVIARFGDHPAGRVLYGYAGLLNWVDWTMPPDLPEPEGGMPTSKRQQIRLARTPEALAGGWHGTRVLNYTEPPEGPTELPAPRGAAHGRVRKHSGYRRGFWKNRIRRGIEGDDGKFIGPVYGPDAVLGETYVYKRGYVRGGPTRADLPPPPGETVYRIPRNAERSPS